MFHLGCQVRKNKWLFFLCSCSRFKVFKPMWKTKPFFDNESACRQFQVKGMGYMKYNDKLISGEHSLCSGCQSVNKACLWGRKALPNPYKLSTSCSSWQLQPPVTLNSPWDCFLFSTPQLFSAPNALVKPLFACNSQFMDKGSPFGHETMKPGWRGF